MYTKPKDIGYTVYTKSNCPACDATKATIPDALFINCDVYLEDADEFLEFVWSLPNADMVKSFPMIFNNGIYFGGYKEISFESSEF